MAQELPDALQLREIKFGSRFSAADRIGLARRYLEAGIHAEALDLFLIAGDEQGIAEVRRHAVSEGRPALLLQLRRAGREVSREEWRAAGEAAWKAGRLREAHRAFSEAGDEEALARLQEFLPDYQPYEPPGK